MISISPICKMPSWKEWFVIVRSWSLMFSPFHLLSKKSFCKMIGDRFIPQQNTRNLNPLSKENKNTTIVQVPPLNMIVLKASGRRRRRRHNPYPPQGFTVVAGHYWTLGMRMLPLPVKHSLPLPRQADVQPVSAYFYLALNYRDCHEQLALLN